MTETTEVTPAETAPLIAHRERHLGVLDGAWSKFASGEKIGFQIARFPDPSGWIPWTFATLA